jgi:hypothetical protein
MRIRAKIFVRWNDEYASDGRYNYTDEQLKQIIVDNKIYNVIAEEMMAPYGIDVKNGKEEIYYNQDTFMLTIYGTYYIDPFNPLDMPFPDERETDPVEWLKDELIGSSFEDGIYEGTDAGIYDEEGNEVCVFDVRNKETLNVELLSMKNVSKSAFEKKTSERYNEYYSNKVDYETAERVYREFVKADNVKKRTIFNKKECNGMEYLFCEIVFSGYYDTERKMVNAFKRITRP